MVAPIAIAVLAAAAGGASAATFYKWTDAQGQVHYGDQPPKGFQGEVTRVDVDPGEHVATPSKAASAEERATMGLPAAPDLLEQRRATRARLEANLAQARERLDLAQKALAEAGNPQDDEWQTTIGQVVDPRATSVSRSNCSKNAAGRIVCPGRVPSEGYYQRQAQLEAEVKSAQQAVDDAEQAYRRGVD
jgi:hypothetical protein